MVNNRSKQKAQPQGVAALVASVGEREQTSPEPIFTAREFERQQSYQSCQSYGSTMSTIGPLTPRTRAPRRKRSQDVSAPLSASLLERLAALQLTDCNRFAQLDTVSLPGCGSEVDSIGNLTTRTDGKPVPEGVRRRRKRRRFLIKQKRIEDAKQRDRDSAVQDPSASEEFPEVLADLTNSDDIDQLTRVEKVEPGDVVVLGAGAPPEHRNCHAVVIRTAETHCTVIVLDETHRFGVGECWPCFEDVRIESCSWRLGSHVRIQGLQGIKTRRLNGFGGVISSHPREGHPTFIHKPAAPDRPQFTLCIRLDDPAAAGEKSVLLEPRFLVPDDGTECKRRDVKRLTRDLCQAVACFRSELPSE